MNKLDYVVLLLLLSWFSKEDTRSQRLFAITSGSDAIESHQVQLYDPSEKQLKLAYVNEKFSFSQYFTRVSPNSQLIAMLGSTDEFHNANSSTQYQKWRLFVVDLAGKEILVQDSVWRFAWAPDGKKIAWISGILYEGKGLPKSYRLQIYDIEKRTTRDLGPSDEIDLSWSIFDGRIYSMRRKYKVSRINPENGSRTATNYKGIFFSPDGKYYFTSGMANHLSAVVDRISNKAIQIPCEIEPRWNFVTWLPDEPACLVVGDVFREKKILNVIQGIVAGEADGVWIGYNGTVKQAFTSREGKVRFWPLSK